MTTIAYNHRDKEIAVDSRLCRGDLLITDKANKVVIKDGVTFVFAGQTCWNQALINMWFGGEVNERMECSALVVDSGVVYDYGLNNEGLESKEAIGGNLYKGSGGMWAFAAMDFGKSAKDAVKYAMTRDIYTGGKVHVIKVK